MMRQRKLDFCLQLKSGTTLREALYTFMNGGKIMSNRTIYKALNREIRRFIDNPQYNYEAWNCTGGEKEWYWINRAVKFIPQNGAEYREKILHKIGDCKLQIAVRKEYTDGTYAHSISYWERQLKKNLCKLTMLHNNCTLYQLMLKAHRGETLITHSIVFWEIKHEFLVNHPDDIILLAKHNDEFLQWKLNNTKQPLPILLSYKQVEPNITSPTPMKHTKAHLPPGWEDNNIAPGYDELTNWWKDPPLPFTSSITLTKIIPSDDENEDPPVYAIMDRNKPVSNSWWEDSSPSEYSNSQEEYISPLRLTLSQSTSSKRSSEETTESSHSKYYRRY
jgi:hypothetical protein